ncbi:MAG: alpha/beta fold hydrolase [Bacteroidales bacterium]|nr:alpha/beta fold hydrolase [Bacteroidales bacterium]
MKKIFLLLILNITLISISNAQFDDRFYFPVKEWDNMDELNYEELTFNIDTISLNAILLKPESKPKVTILFFHGAGGNVSKYTFMTKPLVEAGYQVFMLDARGYGKSTGIPTHTNVAKDAQFVFESIIKRKDIKKTKLIIYGASLGTQIATKLAKDNQTKVSGLILDGTISSFTDMALLSAPAEQKAMIAQYVTSPYSAKEDIKEITDMPKLFIHSEGDKSVPFSQGETVFKNALEPKEFWNYKGNHIDAITISPEILVQKVSNLVNKEN